MSPVQRRYLSLAVGGLLVLVALWEIVAARVQTTSVPDDAAWKQAAAAVRKEWQPGDLIVFAPAWVDPVGRMHLGDLIPIEAAARPNLRGYPRIWELSIRGEHAAELATVPIASETEIAGIHLRMHTNPTTPKLADAFDLIGQAKLEGGGASVVLAEVGFEPHRCIQAVPAPNGKPLRITFPALPAGVLTTSAGLADIFKRRTYRHPAKLDVEIAGQVVASLAPGIDTGWTHAAPVTHQGGPVTFVITADQPERLVCFAAQVWTP
jgi:hypothetical protein